uniref:Uncharacterized protein n=1 Tax=Romanomermis culicivorax TaxID=13658 RepID=A0A915ILZ1_ROMCU
MTSQENRNSIHVDSSDDIAPIIESAPLKKSPLCCSILSPSNPYHRFFVFVFICFLSFGNYFCYDTPSSLQSVLIQNMKIDDAQYGLLYSIYSWPNVVLAFCGGLAIDRYFGVRLGAIVFAFFIACGQVGKLQFTKYEQGHLIFPL